MSAWNNTQNEIQNDTQAGLLCLNFIYIYTHKSR